MKSKTEERNPKTIHLDQMDTMTMLTVINEENMNAVRAVGDALPAVCRAADAASEALRAGGRLFYIGAGTSGRLGVADAAECPPTFGVPRGRVIGIIAGGDKCLRDAGESAEDSIEQGTADFAQYDPKAPDMLVGISASGGAAYVLGAIRYARAHGCVTVGVTSNTGSQLAAEADIAAVTDTGAEVLTGSTRMKAGTAQKLVLNMISTCAMVRQGYVYENLMINLKPTNHKLERRVLSIVTEITEKTEAEARSALDAHDWNIREAVDALQ